VRIVQCVGVNGPGGETSWWRIIQGVNGPGANRPGRNVKGEVGKPINRPPVS